MNSPRRIRAELLADTRARLGEGPVWDEANGRFLWVDILGGSLHATSLAGERRTLVQVEGTLSAVARRASGGLIFAAGDGVWSADDDGGSIAEFAHVEMRPRERWNDAKVDPRGRLLAGTLTEIPDSEGRTTYPPRASRLLRINPDHAVTKVLDASLSNGLGWTVDERTFVYVDTETRCVDTFRYEPDSAELFERRTLVHVRPRDGSPDGLAVDEEGGIWVALWAGHAVHRYLPDGRLEAVIDVPAPNVTSCAFVGKFTQLLITTARDGLSAAELEAEPYAGGLFMAQVGVRGVPVSAFAG